MGRPHSRIDQVKILMLEIRLKRKNASSREIRVFIFHIQFNLVLYFPAWRQLQLINVYVSEHLLESCHWMFLPKADLYSPFHSATTPSRDAGIS